LDEGVYPFGDLTWIIADTHFYHANIGRYCNRPDGWQDLIIENWNRFIQPGDTVFHLGDLALGKKEDTEALVPLLNGKLYLMRGNHDRRGLAFYQSLGITLVKDPFHMEHASGLHLVFLHRPIVPLPLCRQGSLTCTAMFTTTQPPNWALTISISASKCGRIAPGAWGMCCGLTCTYKRVTI